MILVSPRRWGKSSFVKASMEELKQEQKDVRVCYLDAFKMVAPVFELWFKREYCNILPQ